ncbi:MAG: hypothetical protein AAGG06_16685, partial [Pseudomonadota bacterium]
FIGLSAWTLRSPMEPGAIAPHPMRSDIRASMQCAGVAFPAQSSFPAVLRPALTRWPAGWRIAPRRCDVVAEIVDRVREAVLLAVDPQHRHQKSGIGENPKEAESALVGGPPASDIITRRDRRPTVHSQPSYRIAYRSHSASTLGIPALSAEPRKSDHAAGKQ